MDTVIFPRHTIMDLKFVRIFEKIKKVFTHNVFAMHDMLFFQSLTWFYISRRSLHCFSFNIHCFYLTFCCRTVKWSFLLEFEIFDIIRCYFLYWLKLSCFLNCQHINTFDCHNLNCFLIKFSVRDLFFAFQNDVSSTIKPICNMCNPLPETPSRGGGQIPEMIQVCDYDILIVLGELNTLI